MKAIVLYQQGGIDKLTYTDYATPKISETEILVQVEACAINRLDLRARKDRPEVDPFPHILGSDIAGIVADIGPRVSEISVGDRVVLSPNISCGQCNDCTDGNENLCSRQKLIGFHTNGGYAEYVAVPGNNAILIDQSLDFSSAAAIPIAYLTAWHMLITRAKIQPGEDVLILSVGSGVGSAGLQIAKLTGCRVFATASSDQKLQIARQMGADFTVNYKKVDFSQFVLDQTNGRGVNVVLEHVGQATWQQSITSLAKNGRLVTCGVTTGNEGQIDIRKMYQKQLSLLGSALGSSSELRTIIQLANNGMLNPVVDKTLPLSKAQLGHQILEDRANFGKICLSPTLLAE